MEELFAQYPGLKPLVLACLAVVAGFAAYQLENRECPRLAWVAGLGAVGLLVWSILVAFSN